MTPLRAYYLPGLETLSHDFEISRSSVVRYACSRDRKIDNTRFVPCMDTMPPSIMGPGSAIGFSGTKEPGCTSSTKEITLREEDATAENAFTDWGWTYEPRWYAYLPSCRDVNSRNCGTSHSTDRNGILLLYHWSQALCRVNRWHHDVSYIWKLI